MTGDSKPTPYPGEIEEAQRSPNGWVYRIEGRFLLHESVRPEAIVDQVRQEDGGPPLFNELLKDVCLRAVAERAVDRDAEQRHSIRILSILQHALEVHLPIKWAEGRDGTIDGAIPARLEYDDPFLSFFGTAVWYDSEWYEDPLSIRIEFSPDGSVKAYAIRFGDADHGLRKFPYRNHSKHRYHPEPENWRYEFNKA